MDISEIRLNVKHHKILKLIAERNIQFNKDFKGIPAVEFETLYKELNCDFIELNLITARLFSEKECQLYDVSGVKGLFCNAEGLTSYVTKKYLKENRKAILSAIKDTLVIVVAFITIASAIYTASKASKTEASNKQKIEMLQRELDTLKNIKKSGN